MRILWMKPVLPYPPNQGGRRITLQVLRHLASGNEVCLFARRIAPGDARAVDALRREIPGLEVTAPLAPNRRSLVHRAWYRARVRAAARRGIPPVEAYTALPALLDAFSREVSRFDPHLVVAEYWYSMPYLERAAGRARVLFVQDVDYDVRRTGDAAGRADGRDARWAAMEAAREQRALREAPRVWFLTERDRETALRDLSLDPSGCGILPYGIDSEGDLAPRTPADPPEEPDLVLLFGSFAADFNRDALRFTLEAVWPEVRRRRPEARLLVAGGELPAELAARARAAGALVEGDVARVRTVLLRAAVALVPLRFGGGLRIRLLESLALERATVGTPVGVLGMGPRDGREVLSGETADRLALHVTDLLGNPSRRAALGSAGRAWVTAHHALDRAAARQRALVEEAGEGRLTPAGGAD